MIDNYERLVGRLMDLETKFYELQDKYQNLIDSYEKLKETHDAERSGCWDKLTEKELKDAWYAQNAIVGWYSFLEIASFIEDKVKDKNEKNCSRHRDELGTRYDPFVNNSRR
jgi:hypothetical protein